MTDYWTEQEETPMLDVRVIRNGTVVHHEFCEAVSQVNDVTREWGDVEGTTIDIVDLTSSDPHADTSEIELYEDDDEAQTI